MATISNTYDNRTIKVALAAGETSGPVYVEDGEQIVVTVAPGGGGSMKAQLTWSLPADVRGGTATWFDWDLGTVTTASYRAIEKATAVRFIATTQPGVAEVSR